MFWGLNLKPNRKYTQTTSKSFHISQAALDADSASADGANQIFISCENQKFLVCTLRKGACEQAMLDLNFAEGEEISFQSVGSGNVSLSGYLIMEDALNFMNGDDDDEDEESEVETAQDLREALNKKAKAKRNAAENAKKSVITNDQEDDDDDEDDSDFDAEAIGEDDDDGEEEETDDDEEDGQDDDEDDDDEEDEDESEDEEVQQPKAKQPKLEKQQKQQNGIAKESAVAADKKDKKNKKGKKENQQQQQQQQPQQQQQKAGGERVLSGGVKVEDIRVGNGPEAKIGKRAQVYYEGRLKSNNKMFDSLKTGAGFKFGLGRGEVIKGWDVGMVGMKVGGKRRITCPPHMAYGSRGSPPTIPPNSTLVFEVELKGVN